ncbi:MAG: hypothetical protein LBH80_01685 [Prevotellaceae bacterium]|jgi:hypothetical protein|nr:hypothetical protein [Prevotellaceae bacterium]
MPKNTGKAKTFDEILADLENSLAVCAIYKEGGDGFTHRNAFSTPYVKRKFIGKDKNY